MVILCPIKRVPDPYQRVRLNAEGQPDTGSIKWVASPADEAALLEACRLRALRGKKEEVVAVTVGPPESEDVLRAALARGADRALLLTHPEYKGWMGHANPSDSRHVARLLAQAYRDMGANLVLMGRQAPDTGDGQVGPRLAALLELPQITGATAIEWEENEQRAFVTRDGARGTETWEVPLPAVITCDLRLHALPPLPLPAIVGARRKPLERVQVGDEETENQPGMHTLRWQTPPARGPVQMLTSVDELADALRERASLPFRPANSLS